MGSSWPVGLHLENFRAHVVEFVLASTRVLLRCRDVSLGGSFTYRKKQVLKRINKKGLGFITTKKEET